MISKLVVVILLIVEIQAEDDTEWNFKVEYDAPFNITCTYGTTKTMSPVTDTMRWILPNGDIVEETNPPHERVELHMDGKLLRLKHVDDQDFGNYFCLIYDAKIGTYSVVKKGINVDGPYWGDLTGKYRDGIIIGSIAAAIVFVLMIGICYLFERNPVLIGRDSMVLGEFVPKSEMDNNKYEVQDYNNGAMEMQHEIKKPEISHGTFVEYVHDNFDEYFSPCSEREAASVTFGSRQDQCTIQDNDIDEASGLAASRIHQHIMYTHNDKGGSSRIFAINITNGETAAVLEIEDVANYDWEDVAVGPCGTKTCIYIGETGDHGGDGARNTIFRVEEPAVIETQSLDILDQLKFQWDEENCETVMVAPNEDVYIVSKIKGGHGRMAKLSHTDFSTESEERVEVQDSLVLSLSSSKKDPVGGDISANGTEMLIKYKQRIYYWSVLDGDYLGAVRDDSPIVLPYITEDRGESVAWAVNGSAYYTLGEGENEKMFVYKRIP